MISFWEKTFYKYDVAIIGGGISGLSTAISIKEKSPELEIAIFEKDTIPSAASTRNAGFACFGSLTELISDKDKMGTDSMLKLVEKRIHGLELLLKRVGNENLNYENFGGYEVIGEDQLFLLDRMDEINENLFQVIGKRVFTRNDELIKKFGFKKDWCRSLIYNPFEGQIHSGKMLKSLRLKAAQLGVILLSGIEIQDYFENSNEVRLNDTVGRQFIANKLIFCNNAWASKFFPSEDIYPGRGLVLLTKEIDLKFKGAFHFDEGFYYFRNESGRLLIGGGRNEDFEGENTFENAINPKVKRAILEKTEKILNGIPFEEEMWWTGIMGFGNKKMPIVKKVSEKITIGVRLGGMGVALASKIGEEIADEIINEIR